MKTESTYSTPGSSTHSKSIDSQAGPLKVVQVLEAMDKSDEALAGAWAKEGGRAEAEQARPAGDAAVYERRRGPLQPEDEELEQLFQLMQQSNEQIQKAREAPKPMYPELRLVPSVLGLAVDFASEKLSQAGLRVGDVSRDYHPGVPAGEIIAQIPAPGHSAPRMSGVQIIVSRGSPPDQETLNTVRGQEHTAYARIQKNDGGECPAVGIKVLA